ncbi:MAG: hypothetical protein H6841_09250 [Planctomycetes bacterium]|nr:hypothetical protein [Planctomycetota bacterium]MCB9936413.1 hypothetical protein [Planctomycetota bacterium]
MAFVRLLVPLCVVAMLAGCASQERGSEVGEVGFNPRYERELAAQRAAEHYYDYTAPKAGATIRSNPAGALIEWYNDEGIWVSIGNTPTNDIVIEATGKPELFRVSAPGFLPQIRWVAVTPSSEAAVVDFELEPELPSDRYFLGD